jgi:hypothetical protein
MKAFDPKLVREAFFDSLKDLARERPQEAIGVWVGIGLTILEELPNDSVIERNLILDAVRTYEHVLSLAAAIAQQDAERERPKCVCCEGVAVTRCSFGRCDGLICSDCSVDGLCKYCAGDR